MPTTQRVQRSAEGSPSTTWDSQNRLVQCVNGANTSSFVYGADGIRKQSTVNLTRVMG